MSRLAKEKKTIKRELAELDGTLAGEWERGKLVVVGLFRQEPSGPTLYRYKLAYQPGPFRFRIVEPGEYLLVAFVDSNEDKRYQRGEPVAKGDGPIQVGSGARMPGLDLKIDSSTEYSLPVTLDLATAQADLDLTRISRGEVTSIEDARFAASNGSMGMWEPLRFLDEIGGGLYLLEPYSPEKVPVLFVHGIGGHPQEFTYLIEQLDRERFQPWIFFYPSGAELDTLSEFLVDLMKESYSTHGFDRYFVVAHSMGGLVSRSFVNKTVKRYPDGHRIGLFVTLSTPWHGHSAAKVGVKVGPVVVPSWIDIVPGSPFQQSLFAQPLPEEIPFYMLFSYGGRNSIFANGPDDGVVAVSSELYLPAQLEAVKVTGFDESHVGILSSPEASKLLNEILESAHTAGDATH